MPELTFQHYCDQKRDGAKGKNGQVKIPSNIASRWVERVVPAGMYTMGFRGAEIYLDQYGRGVGAEKCIGLALKAEVENCPEMARGFWARAYELETGVAPQMEESNGDGAALAGKEAVARKLGVAVFDESASVLPKHLHPGKLHTMQPVDAPYNREYFITSPKYIGQPKRNGKRQVVIVDGGVVWYQSRARNLGRPFSPEAERALVAAYAQFGAFVLDGELFYLSAAGTEHRTGAQANTANFQAGVRGVPGKPMYGIFSSLYSLGQDLTTGSDVERIKAGEMLGNWLIQWCALERVACPFEVVPTAYTEEEKRALCAKQLAEGREGEIWRLTDNIYVFGESKKGEIYRTKYATDVIGLVTGLTPTTASGRLFGALEISLAGNDGQLVPVGNVGSGFSDEQMAEIAQRFGQSPAGLHVQLTTYGFTEGGMLFQGRFEDFAEEGEALTPAPVAA